MALNSDREKGAHLLRRWGLGASEAELDFYLRGGYAAAVDRLLEPEAIDEGFAVPLESFGRPGARVNMPGLVAWWTLRLLATRRPLRERLTLFWHDHFATSASKVTGAPLMHAQNETLRAHALHPFPKLLNAIARDPAMLFWLDNQLNVKGRPNENFARELMELFTLGIGNYSEQDVQESARAFTGWGFRRLPLRQTEGRPVSEFLFRPAQHDDGPKRFLGKQGPLKGEDILQILLEHPLTPRRIVTKLWEQFVYPNPEPATVAKYADRYRASGMDTRALIRDIALGPEFVSARAERAIYKNPVDFVVVSLRQMGAVRSLDFGTTEDELERLRRLPSIAAATQAMRGMGMTLFYPPDVAGWEKGPAWVTSATMVERMGFAERLFGAPSGQGRSRRAAVNLSAWDLLQDDPTPDGVVNRLTSLLDAPVPPPVRIELVKAVGGRLTAENARATATRVTRLIFATPAFQFS